MMQTKHSSIFQSYNATFPQALTQTWKDNIDKWDKDHKFEPNPYEEIETCNVSISKSELEVPILID